MSFVWASVPAAMITPSMPEPSRASSESTPSTPWAPNRSTIVLVFSGTRSVTTSESIAGIPTRVFVWNAPIRPRPMSPSRMLSRTFLVAEESEGRGQAGTPAARTQSGLATAAGFRPARTSTTPCAASANVSSVPRRVSPIMCGVSVTPG